MLCTRMTIPSVQFQIDMHYITVELWSVFFVYSATCFVRFKTFKCYNFCEYCTYAVLSYLENWVTVKKRWLLVYEVVDDTWRYKQLNQLWVKEPIKKHILICPSSPVFSFLKLLLKTLCILRSVFVDCSNINHKATLIYSCKQLHFLHSTFAFRYTRIMKQQTQDALQFQTLDRNNDIPLLCSPKTWS